MSFEHPFVLALLLLVLPAAAWIARSQAPLAGAAKARTAVLSLGAFALLVVGLAGPLFLLTPTAHRVLVVSAGPGRAAPPLAPDAVVLAGRSPRLLAPGEATWPAQSGPPDLAAALALARAAIPAGEPGEIVVVGTRHGGGRFHGGAPGVPVRVVTQAAAPPAPAIVDLEHPARAAAGEAIAVRVHCGAPGAGQATLRLRQGEAVLAEQEVALRQGVAVPALAFVPAGEGALAFEAELGASRWRFAVLVEGRVTAAHRGDDARRAALRDTLRPYGIDVVAASGTTADALLIDDLPQDAWPDADQRAVGTAVLADGLGLLLAGGRNNLGPGGYARSPLADLLPVEMPQREERRDPSTALVLILDTSASMSGARVELAKEVARLAFRRLLPHDKVGIVEFHGAKRWAAPLQPAANTIEIQRALNRLQAGGGTILYAAIEEAYWALLDAGTRSRHVLVLTDGGVESGPFEALARRMADAGQTLSTVLVGPQGNAPFLRSLAQWGRGRCYACPSRFQMPDLRFKEPEAAPLPATHSGELPIRRGGLHEATAALGGADLPPVLGLVEASLREGASALLSTGDGRPLLSAWDQGRGRVAVLAGDLLGPTAERLQQRPEYGAFLADLVRDLAHGRRALAPRVTVRALGAWAQVEVETDLPPWPAPVLRHAGAAQAMVADVRGRHRALLPWPKGDVPLPVEIDLPNGATVRAALVDPAPRQDQVIDVRDELARLAVPEQRSELRPVFHGRTFLLLGLVAFLLSLLSRRLG